MSLLSDNVKRMRFLQRASNVSKEIAHIPVDQWVLIKHPESPQQPTVLPFVDTTCTKIGIGRFSFNGFNKEIELQMQETTKKRRSGGNDVDISTEEMSKLMSNPVPKPKRRKH
ncbi:hypothetical protein GEMRC1_004471 [Eukaryota sp. GEM-RC1]